MLGLVAEEAGLDLIGIQDHPYQWRFYDTWTLIAYLAGRTSRIRFFPDVAMLPLRPPAILAKSAASLDLLTGGRVELGLGAGAFWDAVAAIGGRRRTPGEAVEATEEAIDLIRLIWSGERGVRYEGAHYQLASVHTGPEPAHEIGISVGASGLRMLDLIGRKADGWVPSAPWASPADLPGYVDRIQQAAVSAGRDPKALRCVYNVSGAVESSHSGDFRGRSPTGSTSSHASQSSVSMPSSSGRATTTHWDRPGCSASRSSPPCAQVGVDSPTVLGGNQRTESQSPPNQRSVGSATVGRLIHRKKVPALAESIWAFGQAYVLHSCSFWSTGGEISGKPKGQSARGTV